MKKNAVLFLALFFTHALVYGQQNDHIFPAAAVARKYIDFDKQGFIINGQKTFLVSAGLEYARIPHQLWKDRLLRLKRDGFNCIEIYTFWNFHEPHEGRFDFGGDHDLDAFLKLVKQMGMYATVRVGPYYCAEWDFGGYPIWLHFKGNFPVRGPNAEFEKYADRYFDTLIPIVSRNQINHGGAVVLVQVENEHDASWGTLIPNQYFSHLREKVLSLGVQVPYFFSGLHHGSDPAGDGTAAFDDPSRPNPWYTTEFWTVWYNYYGSSQKDADQFGRRTWKIIEHGGGGYNYYMAHGGTNFGYTNNNEDAASYDYGAAVGQTGDLRPIYYQFKRNALFARSFESILSNAADASASYKDIVSDGSVGVYARHSTNGDIIFLDNPSSKAVSLQVNAGGRERPSGGNLTMEPGEIMPIVKDFPLSEGVTMDWAVSRVLGVSKQGHTTTLVVYGPAGSDGELQFSADKPIQPVSGGEAFSVSSKTAVLRVAFKDGEPIVYSFKSGAGFVRVVALDPVLADRTWFADYQGRQYVVTGPEYLGDISAENGRVRLTTEHFWKEQKQFPAYIFSGSLSQTVRPQPLTGDATPAGDALAPPHLEALPLGPWQTRDASAAAGPGFDDSRWFASNTAEQMGADGDLSCYAWYRTHIQVRSAGNYILKIRNGGDRATVFVDNVRVAYGKVPGDIVLPNLTEGGHTLVLFTAHSGRDKLYNYYGPVEYRDAKGLSGDLVLQKGAPVLITDWKMAPVPDADAVKNGVPSFDSAVSYKMGEDAFDKKKGYRWFQADLPTEDGHAPKAIYLRNLPGGSAVFVNNRRIDLAALEDGSPGIFISLDSLLNRTGAGAGAAPGHSPATLSIFAGNEWEGHKGGLHSPVEVLFDRKDDIALTGWKMKGGPGDDAAVNGWKPLKTDDTFDRPQFYLSHFNVPSVHSASHAMWRVSFEGLGHGSIWVNGHNLGRYPEKVPISSLYIPECWLVKGNNNIVVYDEDGKRPDKIGIRAETAASRDIQEVSFLPGAR